jgi:uncharacterized protein (TIGR00251 family)
VSRTAGGWFRRDGNDLLLFVRVQARASRNEILDVRDARLRLKTTAAPVDGKANKAVVRMLARHLGIAPSRISLVRGSTARDKELRVHDAGDIAIADAPGGAANGL